MKAATAESRALLCEDVLIYIGHHIIISHSNTLLVIEVELD